MGIPCKTAAGHAELVGATQRLTSRQRAMLLLVDGRRTLEDVTRLGREAGLPRGCIDELFALGLVVIGPPAPPPRAEWMDTDPVSLPSPLPPLPSLMSAAPRPPGDGADALAQARAAVLRALRLQAPVTGAVMMLRVSRARSRAELQALLPAVQARLGPSSRQADVRQMLRRVESLLAV